MLQLSVRVDLLPEEVLQVANFERRVFTVLKQINQVGDVLWVVIKRRSRHQHYPFGVAGAIGPTAARGCFADLLQFIVSLGTYQTGTCALHPQSPDRTGRDCELCADCHW